MQFSLKFPAFSDINPIKRDVLPQLRGLCRPNLAELHIREPRIQEQVFDIIPL